MYKKTKTQLLSLIQWVGFAAIAICISLGQISRWDLLEQIAGADRMACGSSLYPDPKILDNIPSVSVYFPGAALLSIVISGVIGSSHLVIGMHLIAFGIFMAIPFILYRITKEIYADVDSLHFFSFYIFISYFILKFWTKYALEFKPDTIALSIGMLGIFAFSHALKQRNQFWKIAAIFLVGGAIIFKQQYIAFVAGLFLYSLIRKSREWLFFAAGSFMISALVILFIRVNENAWYWTVTVLTDDGFLPIKGVISDHKPMAIAIAITLISLCVIQIRQIPSLQHNMSIFRVKKIVTSTPWPIIALFVFLASFAGAFKVGGNSGNTQFGLVLGIPVFYFLAKGVDRRLWYAASIFAILLQIPAAKEGVRMFRNGMEIQALVLSANIPQDATVLTGSDVYGAARVLGPRASQFENYWAASLRHSTPLGNTLQSILHARSHDYLIIENWPENKRILAEVPKYRLLAENEIGSIYKLQQ